MYTALIFCILVTFVHTKATCSEDLKGKVVVVTGGARGIGKAITENCLKDGATVIFVDYNRTQGLRTEQEFKFKYGSDKIQFIYGDTTTDLERFFKIIFKLVKYVHILINNAGILDEYDPLKMANTNFVATLLWTNKFYDKMRLDKGGEGGQIMIISSIIAYTVVPFISGYKATKSGLSGLCESLGHELNYMRTGVKVYDLCPALTYTEMTNKQMVIDEHVEEFNAYRKNAIWQMPDDVGRSAVTLLKTATSGVSYTVDGGKLSVSPDKVYISADNLVPK